MVRKFFCALRVLSKHIILRTIDSTERSGCGFVYPLLILFICTPCAYFMVGFFKPSLANLNSYVDLCNEGRRSRPFFLKRMANHALALSENQQYDPDTDTAIDGNDPDESLDAAERETAVAEKEGGAVLVPASDGEEAEPGDDDAVVGKQGTYFMYLLMTRMLFFLLLNTLSFVLYHKRPSGGNYFVFCRNSKISAVPLWVL
jgi:hypothetical protein